jgi:hypothetical protein
MTAPVVPNTTTHVAVKIAMPPEPPTLAVGRPDLPVPSLWQKAVGVTRKADGKRAAIANIDHSMMMFRAFYPDEEGVDESGQPTQGRFAPRTEWESFKDWTPDVQYSPEELERQAALQAYQRELEKLDARALGQAALLCEDADPAKSLAKLRVMIDAGWIKTTATSAETVERAVTEVKPKGGKP